MTPGHLTQKELLSCPTSAWQAGPVFLNLKPDVSINLQKVFPDAEAGPGRRRPRDRYRQKCKRWCYHHLHTVYFIAIIHC